MTSQKGLRGIHVFWMVFAFFTVVVAVDAMFIANAVKTFPGEQVKNSYVLGLDYNREVERRDAQARLGWSAEAGVLDEGGNTIVVRLKSSENQPVSGLDLVADVIQAGAGGETKTVSLAERKPGEYAARLDVSAPARLEMQIIARRRDEIVFEASKMVKLS